MNSVTCASIESETTQLPERPASTPFERQMISISKAEYIQLKNDAHCWRMRFERLNAHRNRDVQRLKDEMVRRAERARQALSELQGELERVRAQVKDFQKRLFGQKSEKSNGMRGKLPGQRPSVERPRGHQRGQPGHGRTTPTALPVVVHVVDLPQVDKCCPQCGLALTPCPGSLDSEVVEIEVKAYRRLIRRKQYKPLCQCGVLPAIVTAPVPPNIIPKGKYGISIWSELMLDKFLYGRPTHRLLQSWQALGLDVAPGTVAGGFAHLAPLFAPLMAAFREKQLTDSHWHADETGWKVFEHVEGRKTNRWYLWVYRSTSVIYFDLEPSRAATVPQAHFKGLSDGIVICDRYSAYQTMARRLGLLLAFCWVHVRRDFVTLAQGYPQLESWSLVWIERIGTLYHLNATRMAVRADAAAFAQATVTIEQHLRSMAESRDAELRDATLHVAASKVMMSLRRHWAGLTVFVAYPEIPLDNNIAENAVRGPVVGRKNYYGSGSIWSSQFAASMFTVLLTLDQVWAINARLWMTEFLQACAVGCGTPPDLSNFLPWTMTQERLAHFGGKLPAAPADVQPTPADTS